MDEQITKYGRQSFSLGTKSARERLGFETSGARPTSSKLKRIT